MPEHSIDAFWADYCKIDGTLGPAPATTCFGDSAEMQTALCELALRGVKRATDGLARYYGPDGDPMPKPGDLAIVLDGAGTPRAIIEITLVERAAFNAVSAQFAAEEGEGDGSLAYWRNAHRAFFMRNLTEAEAAFSETEAVILERFRLITPEANGEAAWTRS